MAQKTKKICCVGVAINRMGHVHAAVVTIQSVTRGHAKEYDGILDKKGNIKTDWIMKCKYFIYANFAHTGRITQVWLCACA